VRWRQVVNPLLGFGIHPPAKQAAASECERVHAGAVDHGELYIPIKRRKKPADVFDLDHLLNER